MSRAWRSPLLPLVLLSLFFFSLSLWHLGTPTFPQSSWTPSPGGTVVLELEGPQPVDRMFLLFLEEGEVKLKVSCGSPGEWQPSMSFSGQRGWRQWLALSPRCTTRYLRLTFEDSSAPMGEIALFSASRRLPVRVVGAGDGGGALVDEQGLPRQLPSHQWESYFDEVYFARSAEQYLHRELPFEWTHPPLGKLIIASGILAFGPTPFGWRIPGVIFATLTLPLLYLLARRLFHSPRAALLACFLLTFDFMHFTQSRLATSETFLFFFLALMFYFFVRYYAAEKRQARYLSLTLAAFGLAFAVKWVAAFGLVGVLLLLAGSWRRGVSQRELIALSLGASTAAGIYLLSYIPDVLIGRSWSEVLRLQFSMYGYHAGLAADHPAAAPWWTWPLMLRPAWLYYGEGEGFRSLIVELGNPVLWWGALPALGWVAWQALKWRNATAAFIVVPFLSQWLLFMTIPRILFIYHYYPNVIFSALAVTLALERFGGRWRTRVYLGLSLALFVFFYPFISGLPLPQGYWERLEVLVKWVT